MYPNECRYSLLSLLISVRDSRAEIVARLCDAQAAKRLDLISCSECIKRWFEDVMQIVPRGLRELGVLRAAVVSAAWISVCEDFVALLTSPHEVEPIDEGVLREPKRIVW